ncbi:hypothetical protein H8E07_01410 [bacterium]|nr:hypothetical protein [bacterium]
MRIPIDLGPLEIADLLEARADDDDVAAAAYEAFGRSVFPFEGVFLDPEASARGSLSELLREPDVPVARLRTWAPPFCCALRDLGSPVADAVADSLASLLSGPAEEAGELVRLRGRSPDLGDPSVGVNELVDWLCTPVRCGMFLSSPVLERLGRELNVPRGFGSRRRLLTNLLRAGAQYGRADRVVDGLRGVVERHRGVLGGAVWRTGVLRAASEPWCERLAETSVRLAEAEHRLELAAQRLPA